MSSLCTPAHRLFGRCRAFVQVGVLLFASATAMWAQCAPLTMDAGSSAGKFAAKAGTAEPLEPESAYLSNSVYTNEFFGFGLDLPIEVWGHMIVLPVMPERQHALLALVWESGLRSGALTITAVDPTPGLEGLAADQQQQHQTNNQATQSTGHAGPMDRIDIPDYMMRSGRFYSSMRHKGKNYAAIYWTRIKNYNIRVAVTTNDQELLQRTKRAMAAVRFYCTQDDGTLSTPDGTVVKPEGDHYEGPTVPTARVYAAIQDKPGLEIPPGEVKSGVYKNPDLGLKYEVPKGWDVLPTHNSSDPPEDAIALREFEFLHACSRTLLQITQHDPGEAAEHGTPPAIILRALDPNCLSLRTPTSLGDKRTVEEAAAALEALREFGEISSEEVASIADHMFMVFHGTIASYTAGEELSHRVSETIFVTRHDKLLFVWSFMAPTSAELNAIPAGGITLGDSPVDLHTTLTAKK